MSFAGYRFEQVDFLSWMSFHRIVFACRKPEETSSFMALVYPFDLLTWVLTLVSSMVLFSILTIMQILWSFASGQAYMAEYLFQGKVHKILHISFTKIILLFRCLPNKFLV